MEIDICSGQKFHPKRKNSASGKSPTIAKSIDIFITPLGSTGTFLFHSLLFFIFL
jgi:hypothetical protein